MAFHPATVFATAFLLATPIVSAQAAGDDAQRDACTPDTLRLCRGAMTSVAGTTACLVAHRAALSATCRGVFAFAEPVVDRAPPAPAEMEHTRVIRSPVARAHARVRSARAYPHVRVARAYHIPHFDQAEAEAEVHAQYRYRTPYLPYWVFP